MNKHSGLQVQCKNSCQKNLSTDNSSEDYLFDALEEALIEAEDKFGIPKNSWKEVSLEAE